MASSLIKISLITAATGMLSMGSAFAKNLRDLQGLYSEIMNVQATCGAGTYSMPERPPAPMPTVHDRAECNSCRQAIDSAKRRVQDTYPSAVANSEATNAQVSQSAAQTGARNNGMQQSSEMDTGSMKGTGSTGLANNTAQAGKVAEGAKACMTELEGKCAGKIATEDYRAGSGLMQKCEKLAAGAEAVAQDKAQSGNAMEGLGKLAEAAGQMLGPLMQAMQGQGNQQDPYQSQLSNDAYKPDTTQAAPGASGLGSDRTQVASTGFSLDKDNATGASFAGANKNGVGFQNAASRALASEPSLAAALGGSDYGSFDGGKNSVASTSPTTGGGGMGGLNSSGASMMSDAEKAAAEAAAKANGELENYEIGAGGGGGSKPFLGLKGKASDLSEFTGMDSSGGMLGDLGLNSDGNFGDFASENAGIGGEDGATIFRMVHTKYAEMKKRGSI